MRKTKIRQSGRPVLATMAGVVVGVLPTMALAQPPTLAPTTDVTIVVGQGPLHYSSISIPLGVTVRFSAPGFGPLSVPGMPAVVVCDGDAVVRGAIAVAGDIINDRPAGWVTTGTGARGTACGTALFPPQGGRHAGLYGSPMPFSLEGGSPGGFLWQYDPSCMQFLSESPGGEAGGTLVLLAGGRIDVHGTITADGDVIASGGAGGSILLRGENGVTIHPGAVVTAQGAVGAPAPAPWPPTYSDGGHGYVRLDAWGAQPTIHGTVTPAPTVVALPYIHAPQPPRIGTTWVVDFYAPDNTPIFIAAAPLPDPGTPTPFGLLGIDLPTAVSVAFVITQPGHDPRASLPWAVPNAPALIGLSLWVQALAAPAHLPARLTNTVATVVG